MLTLKKPDQALATHPPALHSSIVRAMITAGGELAFSTRSRSGSVGIVAAEVLMAHLPQLHTPASCHPPHSGPPP